MLLPCLLLGSLAFVQGPDQQAGGTAEWRILKPSNTGIPGDYVNTIFIDADDLPHVFEPFYRGKRAKDDQVQGSGLGLSLVKKIVEGHNGKVSVSSDGGARFRLLLPAVKA